MEKSLLALEQQTFRDFDVILVDDASSDNTVDLPFPATGVSLRLAQILSAFATVTTGTSRNFCS